MSSIFAKLILICWPTAVVSFFISLWVACPYNNKMVNLIDYCGTWSRLFSAIVGKYGIRATVFGVLYFIALITGILGMGAFFIGGIFCSQIPH